MESSNNNNTTSSSSFAPVSPDLSSYYAADPEPILPPQHHQHYRGSISHINPYLQQQQQQQQQSPVAHFEQNQSIYVPTFDASPTAMPRTRAKRQLEREEEEDEEYMPLTPHESTERMKGLSMDNGAAYHAPQAVGVPPSVDMGIVVRTKFPVARIKRIMQADDDVGKVAQVTPVAVSKALELFMISLITKAATEAKSRNSKRVAATHLKQAITKDKQFDFLEDIVSKVADAPAAAEKNDDDDLPEPKKRKNSSRKKKKEDSD